MRARRRATGSAPGKAVEGDRAGAIPAEVEGAVVTAVECTVAG